MSIVHLNQSDRSKLKDHGHPECWEVARYGPDEEPPGSVVLECTRCGEVLLELILEDPADVEKDPNELFA